MLKIVGIPTSTSFNFSCTETMRTYANNYSTLCTHYPYNTEQCSINFCEQLFLCHFHLRFCLVLFDDMQLFSKNMKITSDLRREILYKLNKQYSCVDNT